MSDDLGDMIVSYKADLSDLTAGSARAKAELRSVDNTARSSSGGFSVLKFAATEALLEVGKKAVEAGVGTLKMAGDFHSGITTLVTGAGESQKNIGMISDGILALGPAVGETTKQLTDGMFEIESSGQHGARALLTLKDAAEGAKVGGADLGAVANGVTTEMTDYASSNLTAAQATNDLIATVASGKTHMQDLASSFAQILPTAAAAHVSLTDVSGAMATMTAEGVPAANAATYLRQTIIGLEAPGSKAVSTLAGIGLSSKTVAAEMQTSLPGALQMITDALKKKFPEGSAAYVAALKDIAGGSKNMQGILDLTGDHLQTFKDDVGKISDAVKKGGDSINGWSLVQQDFNQKLDEAKSEAETLGIELGDKLIPVASEGLDLFQQFATSLNDTSSPVRQLASDLETFGSNVENTVEKSGAFQSILQTIKDTLPGVEQFVGNVADAFANKLLPPTLSLIKNFSAWVDKSNIVNDTLHILGDDVQTVAGILGPFIQDVSNLFGWLSQNKPAADALKDAVIALGGAFVALKIYDQIASFQNMFSKVKEGTGIVEGLASVFGDKLNGAVSDFLKVHAPNLKTALGDVGTKAKGAADDVASIGKNAKQSATDVAEAALAEETDLGNVDTKVTGVSQDLKDMGPAAAAGGDAATFGLKGFLGILGTIAGYAGLLALPFLMDPNHAAHFPDKKDQYPAPPSFWDFITHVGLGPNQIKDITDLVQQTKTLGDDAQRVADNLKNVKQNLDDLPKGPGVHIVDGDIVKLGTNLTKLDKPVTIDFQAPNYNSTHNHILSLNTDLNTTGKGANIPISIPDYIPASGMIRDLDKSLDNLKLPVKPPIDTGSVEDAQTAVNDLKRQLENLSGDVYVHVDIPQGYGFHGHALGGFSPIGEPFMFNEQGPELGMAVPGGVQIWSHSQSMNMLGGMFDEYHPAMYPMMVGGGEVIEIHNEHHHYWNGQEVTGLVMTQATSTVRRRGRNRR